jgi:hypothetical protein
LYQPLLNITCTYLTLTGIGGLTAAAGLRKEGHEVIVRLRNSETPITTDSKQLLERSQLAQESGAAMHLAPNCHGILKRFGIFPETIGANRTQGVGVIFFCVKIVLLLFAKFLPRSPNSSIQVTCVPQ